TDGDVNKLAKRAVRERCGRKIAGFGQLRSATPGRHPMAVSCKKLFGVQGKQYHGQNRNPKSEIRKQSEARTVSGIRLVSDFGHSDFGFPATVHRSDKSARSSWRCFR